ncbi:hypothetical protein KKA17_10950 [bacterium]|nr:hypothetical protein [bacterium]MBU1883846.1 hypothetical protein [bacterium]
MPRRKELKSVVEGMATSFISRNNDIDGYWGMGKLYKKAYEMNTNTLILDLYPLEESIENDINSATKFYYDFLMRQLEVRGFKKGIIRTASVILSFQCCSPTELEKLYKNVWGEPFLCKVVINDDLGKTYTYIARSCCRKYDPVREIRSTRVLRDTIEDKSKKLKFFHFKNFIRNLFIRMSCF